MYMQTFVDDSDPAFMHVCMYVLYTRVAMYTCKYILLAHMNCYNMFAYACLKMVLVMSEILD